MKNKKFLIAGIILAVAVIGLIYNTALNTSATHLRPAEFKKKTEGGQLRKGTPIKLVGTVVKGSIDRSGGKLRFNVKDKTAEVEVVYEGAIPDTFAAEREVILEGPYKGVEPFEATQLIAKCPSKYQAKIKGK